jgi:hypothetical protein
MRRVPRCLPPHFELVDEYSEMPGQTNAVSVSAAKDLDKSRKPSQAILRPAEPTLTGAFLICDRLGYSPKKPRRAVSAPAGSCPTSVYTKPGTA